MHIHAHHLQGYWCKTLFCQELTKTSSVGKKHGLDCLVVYHKQRRVVHTIFRMLRRVSFLTDMRKFHLIENLFKGLSRCPIFSNKRPSCPHHLNVFGAVWFPTNMGGIFHGSVSEEKKDIFLLISHLSLTATEKLYGAT